MSSASQNNQRTKICIIDPLFLRFHDQFFDQVYKTDKYNTVINESIILLYLRLAQSIFVILNVYLDFKELQNQNNDQSEIITKKQIFCLTRVMAQIIALVSHYAYIKLAKITQHWLFFHLHPFFLQISFFTIMIF